MSRDNMCMFLFCLISIFINLEFAQAGAKFTLDHANKIANMYFKVVLYGKIQDSILQHTLQGQTELTWNGRGLYRGDRTQAIYLNFQGKPYQIHTKVDVEMTSYEDGLLRGQVNTEPYVNFFYTNYGVTGGATVSYVKDLGVNCGYLEVNMQMDTLAHEVGHTFYLNHRNRINQNARVPLMFPFSDPTTIAQDVDTQQIVLPSAPDSSGNYILGTNCTPSQLVKNTDEPETGSAWDGDPDDYTDLNIKDAKLYPNPNHSHQPVYLDFYSTRGEDWVDLVVLDNNGRQIAFNHFPVHLGQNHLDLNIISRLNSGVYFLKMLTSASENKNAYASKSKILLTKKLLFF